MKSENKFFPNLKKNIKSFLTDESWKISKKSALGLWAWVLLVASLWQDTIVNADSHSSSCWHTNTLPHLSWTNVWASYPNLSVRPPIISNWVNWHSSTAQPPLVSDAYYKWTTYHWIASHTNDVPHSSHCSHWSHWSHWSY